MSNEQQERGSASELTQLLERLIDEVQKELGIGGLGLDTMYGEFAMEVAKRAAFAEREACATFCEWYGRYVGDKKESLVALKMANEIRERSNAKLTSGANTAPETE